MPLPVVACERRTQLDPPLVERAQRSRSKAASGRGHVADLDEYLTAFAAEGHSVADGLHATCGPCSDAAGGFRPVLDDEEGAAVRTCATCGSQIAMLDCADYLEDADLGGAACPCGHEVFDAAVGFALREDGEIRWVSIGLRCLEDGWLGVYAGLEDQLQPLAAPADRRLNPLRNVVLACR